MQFWVGWALWQKLSTVLGFLITIVLIYSFCVLIYNRRMTKKFAAAEEYQRAQQDAELHPMLARASDVVPFGARALERGYQVEGIWVSDSNTSLHNPKKAETVVESRPSSVFVDADVAPAPAVVKEQTKTDMAVPLASHVNTPDRRMSITRDDNTLEYDKAPSFLSNSVSTIHHAHPSPIKADEQWLPNEEHIRQPPPNRLSIRHSWFGKWTDKQKRRPPVVEGIYPRRSSEEFRRRISRFIDEGIQMRPAEAFQLNPFRRAAEESHKRRSRYPSPQP